MSSGYDDTGYKIDDMVMDADRAFQNASRYHAELKEVYRYFAPHRTPTVEQAGAGGEGSQASKRTQVLFDGTGPSAAAAFVSNMKADWLPAFEDFFKLANGPLFVGNPDETKARSEVLQGLTIALHALTQHVRATATEEMFADLFGGTGHLVINPGDKRRTIRGFAVPVLETAIENGPWGEVERWFWRRTWKTRDIEAMWPHAKIGDGLAQAIKQDRNADVKVTQYTYWNPRENHYSLCVWTDKDPKEKLWQDFSLTAPWVTPRMYLVPGEPYGRGLAHLGLPFVKTVNKARELALRAAAFALLGLWTRRHDGVFNPDTAIMTPGAMWKVASNGTGGMGPSISRLDIPHNFDVSTIIINDERGQIRRVLLDDELPELTDRVRSPTEIAGRRRRYERNRGGATTRLAFELVQPFVQRGLEVMSKQGLIKGQVKIDDLLTQAQVVAPAATAQRSDRVDRFTSWLQIMVGLVGPQMTNLIAEVEAILPEIGRDLGVDEKFIRKGAEVEQLKAMIDQAVQQKLEEAKAAEQQKQLPPPAPAPEMATGAAGGF